MGEFENYNYSIMFFSDSHLTLDSIDLIHTKLSEKLSGITTKTFLINGDFIDETVEYYSKNKQQLFISKLHTLLQFIQQHCEKIVLIYGNHDEFFLKKHSKTLTKNLQIKMTNSYTINYDYTSFIFLHGHQFDSRYMYHSIQKIIPFRRKFKKYTKSSIKKVVSHKQFDEQSIKRKKKFIVNKLLSSKLYSATRNKNYYLILGHFHKNYTFTTSISYKNLPELLFFHVYTIAPLYVKNSISLNALDVNYRLTSL